MKSPSGGSILNTSAPKSASSRVQYGPETIVVKSRTRMPARMSLFIRGLGTIFFLEQRKIVAIEALQVLFHLSHRGIAVARLEVFHETTARRHHPRIALLPDGA